MHRAGLDTPVVAHLLDRRADYERVVPPRDEVAGPAPDQAADGAGDDRGASAQAKNVPLHRADLGPEAVGDAAQPAGLPTHGGDHGAGEHDRAAFGDQPPRGAARVELH